MQQVEQVSPLFLVVVSVEVWVGVVGEAEAGPRYKEGKKLAAEDHIHLRV